jgi:hypothetical protein
VLVDAAHHRALATRIARRPDCRFDHARWDIERTARGPRDLTFEDALALARPVAGAESRLAVAGSPFVTGLTCPGCGARTPLFRLEASLRRRDRRCARCDRERLATGFDTLWELDSASLRGKLRGLPVGRAGMRSGDVVTVAGPEGESHHELA